MCKKDDVTVWASATVNLTFLYHFHNENTAFDASDLFQRVKNKIDLPNLHATYFTHCVNTFCNLCPLAPFCPF